LYFIISLDKSSAFWIVKSRYFNEVVFKLNDPSQFEWSQSMIPKEPSRFEDLTGLFFCCPLNRGIIRQDFDESALLFKHISQIDSPKGVEIGRFFGGSTVLLATAVGRKGLLYSIELEPKNNDTEWVKSLQTIGLEERVKLIIGNANDIKIDEELDFVFIDGDHSLEGARLDHNKWGAKVKRGGYIIHHDMADSRKYSTQWKDLRILYETITFVQKGHIEALAEAGSMIVFQKISDTWVDIPPRSE
jgi:hypothetical protein